MDKPEALWQEFWEKSGTWNQAGAENWRKSAEAAQKAWFDTMSPTWRDAFGPYQEMQRQAMQTWGGMLPQFQTQCESTPGSMEGLGKAASENMQAAIQAMFQASTAMAARMEANDPQALQRIWKALSDEYLRDMEGLPQKMAAGPRTQELARFAAEIASGNPSAEARKYLERFTESMQVKAAHGWEIYADPNRTPVGLTPRKLAFKQGALNLYRYGEAPGKTGRPPLVMIYSIINKAYILDLVEGSSVIRHLLDRGLDVWLVEWDEGKPGSKDTLDEWLNPCLKSAIGHVQDETGFDQVGLFGWCVGGTMALVYTALFPEDVAGLITLTTPVTSTGSGVLELWLDKALFPLDDILAAHGHMPGRMVRQSLIAIKPYLEIMKWRSFYENLHDDQIMSLFLPVDRWANDNPDVASEVFRKFVVDIYREDRLVRGLATIHGKPVDLKRVTCPVLNLIAKKDWIVPPEAAAKLIELVGSTDRVNEMVPGPHVGLILDPRARATWDRMADFVTSKCAPPPAE